MKRQRVAAAAVLALLLCGGAAGAAPKAKTHTVTIVDSMHYEPATLTVRLGETVVWVNKDVVQHTATAVSGTFNSPAIDPGKTWKVTLRKKGTLPYTCRYHPMMQGQLTVK